MNWLGRRQPELCGRPSVAEPDDICRRHSQDSGYDREISCTNSEGAARDHIYALTERDALDGLVINPAGWSVGGGSSARFCLKRIERPCVAVQIRRQYRMKNVSTPADGVIQGLGIDTCFLVLAGLHRMFTRTITA